MRVGCSDVGMSVRSMRRSSSLRVKCDGDACVCIVPTINKMNRMCKRNEYFKDKVDG